MPANVALRSEVIRPPRIPWARILVALTIASVSWTASRVLEGLERADRQAVERTYEPAPVAPVPECRFGEWLYTGDNIEWRCGP